MTPSWRYCGDHTEVLTYHGQGNRLTFEYCFRPRVTIAWTPKKAEPKTTKDANSIKAIYRFTARRQPDYLRLAFDDGVVDLTGSRKSLGVLEQRLRRFCPSNQPGYFSDSPQAMYVHFGFATVGVLAGSFWSLNSSSEYILAFAGIAGGVAGHFISLFALKVLDPVRDETERPG